MFPKILTRALSSESLQTTRRIFKALLIVTFISFSSCYRVPDKLDPQINYSIQDKYIRSLKGAFPPLDESEKKQEWGKEYLVGVSFAQKLDLYRAVTAFKRAEIFVPQNLFHRKQEIEYFIIFAYYLGNRYEDAIDAFDDSSLGVIDQKFPAYHDLLVILYESYKNVEDDKKAAKVLHIIKANYPETAKRLELATALSSGNLKDVKKMPYDTTTKEEISHLIADYKHEKKSIGRAQLLNAAVPGAGFFYVGQKQSALTSVLLNSLFIAAAYHFFSNGHTAAGIITASIEAGWYFGGIYGAGEAAKLYNERVYEAKAFNTLNQRQLFPVFFLNYGF